MCGFLVAQSELVSDRKIFSKALDLQTNRGPDAKNFFFDPLLSAGHVRLAIQDLSSLGDQPFLSKCSNYVLIYNGEIFNVDYIYAKYCRDQELISTSDTEVLLYAIMYADDLADLLSDIDGFFSFIFYDKVNSRITACRDSKGTKPLYYAQINGKYVFSSDTASIRFLQSSNLVAYDEIDYSSLAELCSTKYISSGNTSYASIKEVLKGHAFSLSLKDDTSRSFLFDQSPKTSLPLIESFQCSVKHRLLSDAPVATLLSGGLDSSLVTASANSIKPVHSFTVSFPGYAHDESSYASLIANQIGCNHTLIPFPTHQLPEIAELLFKHVPYPIVDSSSFPLHVACDYISSLGFKVLLTGDGADEYFCGYPRYNLVPLIYSLRTSLIGAPLQYLMGLLADLPPSFLSILSHTWLNKLAGSRGLAYRIGRFTSYFSQPIESLVYESNYLRPFAFDSFQTRLPPCRFNHNFPYNTDSPVRHRMMSIDHALYLPNCLLRKSDLISMLSSIEARSPFLSNYMRSISHKLFSTSNRPISKTSILQPLLNHYELDPALFTRPKQGFGGPLPIWIRNELYPIVQKYLLCSHSSSLLFNREHVLSLLSHIDNDDYSQFIWSLTAISAWVTYHTNLAE